MEIARLILEYLKAFLNIPVIGGCITVFALIRYESTLKSLIDRKVKVSLPGGQTFEIEPTPQQQIVTPITTMELSEGHGSVKTTEDTKGLDKLRDSYVSPLIPEQEDRIRNWLNENQITKPDDREKELLRVLAATQLHLAGEQIYQAIWGSQIAALRFTNGCANRFDKSILHPFYEQAKTNFPDWYTNKPFDDWLGFMVVANLLLVDNQKVSITVAGREFLKFLAETGKLDKPIG